LNLIEPHLLWILGSLGGFAPQNNSLVVLAELRLLRNGDQLFVLEDTLLEYSVIALEARLRWAATSTHL